MTHNRISALLAVALFIVLVSFHTVNAQGDSAKSGIGNFKFISGPIKFGHGVNSVMVEKSINDALKTILVDGDKIVSGDQTTGEIETNYGARLSFLENTELQILPYAIRINRGGVWINYKPEKTSGGKIVFKSLTPVGVIGVRGTEYAVSVDEKGENVKIQVREGTVVFESVEGESRPITAGEAFSAAKGEKLGSPYKMDVSEDILVNCPAGQKKNDDSKRGTIERNEKIMKYGEAKKGEKFDDYLKRIAEDGHSVKSMGGIEKAYLIYKECGGDIDEFITFDEFRKQFGINDINEYNKALKNFLTNSYENKKK